jgi:hypothetical protein
MGSYHSAAHHHLADKRAYDLIVAFYLDEVTAPERAIVIQEG